MSHFCTFLPIFVTSWDKKKTGSDAQLEYNGTRRTKYYKTGIRRSIGGEGYVTGDQMRIYDMLEYDDLPNDDLKFIAGECGIETARDFLRYFRGAVLYIPQKVLCLSPSLKQLLNVFGRRELGRIIDKIGGMKVTVPMKFSPQFAKKYIDKNFTGDNISELAIDLGLSHRTIYKLLPQKQKGV